MSERLKLSAAILSLLCLSTAGGASAQDASPSAPAAKSAQPADAAAAKPKSDGKKKTAAPDRLELDKTVVTGNRELPKVLYIVPWKKSEIGDLPAQPFNTLLDEALTPVDRDVFRRELSYYDALQSDGQGADKGKPAPPASQGEK